MWDRWRERAARGLRLVAWLVLAACGCTSRPEASGSAPAPDATRNTPPAAAPEALDLPPEIARAFHAQPGFARMSAPKEGEWLDRFDEPGQSVAEFERADRVVPTAERSTVFIVPLGAFAPELGPDTRVLVDYVQRFAGVPVQVLPALPEDALRPVRRRMRGDVLQLLSGDLLQLLQAKLPASAFGLLGITTRDLFPGSEWNFVFGEARFTERVGVYSFARYDPRFHGEPRGPDARRLALERSLKIMTHELGHMFGMAHCTAYRCLMNGSNSLEETDAAPLHLCPVCLRKLHTAVGFSPAVRYAALETFYLQHGLEDAADWVNDRARYLKAETAR